MGCPISERLNEISNNDIDNEFSYLSSSYNPSESYNSQQFDLSSTDLDNFLLDADQFGNQ